MAVLLDLSNELIIIIASNVSKPSHILQLALVNKRIHGIAIQHLYENLTFKQDDYSPLPCSGHDFDRDPAPLTQDQGSFTDPHSNILRLSSMIRSNTLPAGRSVTRLTMVIGINNDCDKFQTSLSLLLPQLSSLKNLTLKSVCKDPTCEDPYWEHEEFSLATLAAALSPTSQTLQSLSMHFSRNPEDYMGRTIGSLRHFSKLEYLSVQGDVLLKEYPWVFTAFRMSLTSILPRGLRCLRLHRCRLDQIQSLRTVLDCFVLHSLRVLSKTEKVVVQLEAKATNHINQSVVFEAHMPALKVEAGPDGLDLEMALEWREDYHWQERSPSEKTLFSQLYEWMQKLDEIDI